MHVLRARNVNDALLLGLNLLEDQGERRDSRNGPVVVASGPVTTVYSRPLERVIFWPQRDANPFFHLYESLWMLNGGKEVAPLARFVERMRTFSDDGVTLHGAYGNRWRNWFGMDQLKIIAQQLRERPDDRRNVLAMWDAPSDLGREGKDLPCNTHAYLSRGSKGELNMTVCCRSNDIIWGAYGANAVHFSYLLEYVAAMIGCPVGTMWQISNNFHAYLSTLEPLKVMLTGQVEAANLEPYGQRGLEIYPLVSTPVDQWQQDLKMFLEEGPVIGLRDPFFRRVATPMFLAHKAYREGEGRERFLHALEVLEQMHKGDWYAASREWLERRLRRFDERGATAL